MHFIKQGVKKFIDLVAIASCGNSMPLIEECALYTVLISVSTVLIFHYVLI